MKQTESLIRHFVVKGSISNVEAQSMYKIRALPRRIKDLEMYAEMTFTRLHKTDATGQRYVRYVHNTTD
jgi:hypothetical protein